MMTDTVPAAWLAPLLSPVEPGRGLAVAVVAALLVLAVTRLGGNARTGPPAA